LFQEYPEHVCLNLITVVQVFGHEHSSPVKKLQEN